LNIDATGITKNNNEIKPNIVRFKKQMCKESLLFNFGKRYGRFLASEKENIGRVIQ